MHWFPTNEETKKHLKKRRRIKINKIDVCIYSKQHNFVLNSAFSKCIQRTPLPQINLLTEL